MLVLPPSYCMNIQARIPAALAALHNFILQHDPDDRVDARVHDPSPGSIVAPDVVAALRLNGELAIGRHTDADTHAGEVLRDQIADAMWTDYQRVLAERVQQGLPLDEENLDEEEEGDEEEEDNGGDEDDDIITMN